MNVNILHRVKQKIQLIILILFVLLMAVFFILPIVYVFVSSLKPLGHIFEFPIRLIPKEIRLQNYTDPFVLRGFGRYFINSISIAIIVTLSSVALGSLAGYSLAKFDYRGVTIFFALVLATMMLPIEVTMVPLAIVSRELGIMNTYLGLYLPVMVKPFAIFWMRQFIITIPNAYMDAARIDGLGEFGIFWKIVFPMSAPALGALAIFSFTTNWNSLVWPLIVVAKDSLRTIPLGIMKMQGEFEVLWNEIFGVSILAVLPAFVLFFLAKEKLIHGMTMVGIKG